MVFKVSQGGSKWRYLIKSPEEMYFGLLEPVASCTDGQPERFWGQILEDGQKHFIWIKEHRNFGSVGSKIRGVRVVSQLGVKFEDNVFKFEVLGVEQNEG